MLLILFLLDWEERRTPDLRVCLCRQILKAAIGPTSPYSEEIIYLHHVDPDNIIGS